MGYDVTGWLKNKVFGTGENDPQEGVSGYMKPKERVTKALDEAGDIASPTPRRGDSDGEYDTYAEDRNMDNEDEESD